MLCSVPKSISVCACTCMRICYLSPSDAFASVIPEVSLSLHRKVFFAWSGLRTSALLVLLSVFSLLLAAMEVLGILIEEDSTAILSLRAHACVLVALLTTIIDVINIIRNQRHARFPLIDCGVF